MKTTTRSRRASPLAPAALLFALVLPTVLGLTGTSGCNQASPAPWNVVFVAVDTLRADHVGTYGYERSTTPFLDELGARSVVAEHMVAQCPWTKPSVASILTSLLPSQHKVVEEGTQNGLDSALVTLPEVLQHAGYRTACFSANPHIGKSTGFAQGFDVHAVPEDFESDVNWALDRTANWLDGLEQGRPFFLYVQVLDPHDPYQPEAGSLERFGHTDLRSQDERALGGRAQEFLKAGELVEPLEAGDVDTLRLLYDAELFETDTALRELVSDLERRGLADNTIVVVTSDHGEEFLDHGTLKHGYQLYEELTRVPLIFHVPGLEPLRFRDGIVQHVDLAPTLLDFLGLEAPAQFRGRSFADAFRGGEAPDPVPVVTETSWRGLSRQAIREGDWKLIVDHRSEAAELYDLAADPLERANRIEDHPEVAEHLLQALATATESLSGVVVDSEMGERDADAERALLAIGYFGD